MTVVATATDQELVAAARRGDDRAFEQLYARYRKRIAGYCYRLTQDYDRADDIAQEVFISALRRLREHGRPIAFRPWIYEIARNACIDEHRRRGRVREIPIDRDGDMEWSGRSAPPPEVAVESKQRLDDLRGAFRGLSERHHKIIVLREFEGLSYSQIGDQLGMSKMVVESTLFRARRRLTEEYEDLASGRRCQHVLGLLGDDESPVPRRLGLKDRRALTQHLEHCPSCRREARDVDLDRLQRMGRLGRRGRGGKVAALLPIPLLPLPGRLFARVAGSGRNALGAALPAGLSAARYSDGVLTFIESGRAAITAATLLAAVGGGLATGLAVQGDAGSTAAPISAAAADRGGVDGIPAGAGSAQAAGSLGVWAKRATNGQILLLASGPAVSAGTAGAGAAAGAELGGAGLAGRTGGVAGSSGGSSGRTPGHSGVTSPVPGARGLVVGGGSSTVTGSASGAYGSAGTLAGATGSGVTSATGQLSGATGSAVGGAVGTTAGTAVGTLSSAGSTSPAGSGSSGSLPGSGSVVSTGAPTGSGTGGGVPSGTGSGGGQVPTGVLPSAASTLPGSSGPSGSLPSGGGSGTSLPSLP